MSSTLTPPPTARLEIFNPTTKQWVAATASQLTEGVLFRSLSNQAQVFQVAGSAEDIGTILAIPITVIAT
jgi:hypothetical protein